MRISVNVAGIDELVALLNGPTVHDAIVDGVTEATALLLNRTRTRFLEQVDPDGVPWEPSYAAFKRSFSGRGGGTLFDTGTLFHSIQLFSVNPLEGAIGTDVGYGAKHNFGTDGMVKRQFLGFSEDDNELALKVFMRKIDEALS